ncbi:hypothetical protein JQR85_03625 [Stutzerimonas urumqiensis]|uniref:hypothetical protein n=1 Tax=Stutzerimonas urumqiensis TaxID=638269 RepID=UPI0013CF2297|nr:hypothetical protein [Stutzerimonas urumqiensis]
MSKLERLIARSNTPVSADTGLAAWRQARLAGGRPARLGKEPLPQTPRPALTASA